MKPIEGYFIKDLPHLNFKFAFVSLIKIGQDCVHESVFSCFDLLILLTLYSRIYFFSNIPVFLKVSQGVAFGS